MSSLSVLKKELEELDEVLLKEVQKQVDLEEQLENQKDTVRVVQKHFDKLSRALDILEGRPPQVAEDPAGVEPPNVPVSPPAKEVPPAPKAPRNIGPICSACGDTMIRLGRTTRSGVYVEYWGCSDAKCGNEQY